MSSHLGLDKDDIDDHEYHDGHEDDCVEEGSHLKVKAGGSKSSRRYFSRTNAGKRHAVFDTDSDFVDKEEELETALRTALQISLH